MSERRITMTRRRAVAAMAAVGLALCGTAQAQSETTRYPAQPIKWIVPYAPGGGSDMIARLVSTAMRESLGQPLLVDNRPGAGTIIGTQAMMAAAPDGYTVSSADIGTLAFNPTLYAKLPYEPQRSFTYIGGLSRNSFVLAVRKGLPVNTLREFLSLAAKSPDTITFASAGAGSPHHVAMEMFQQTAQIKLLHVAYRGGAPALQDLISGQVDAMMLDIPGGLAHIKSGSIKVLGVAMPERFAPLPQIPTLAEGGVSGFSAYSWQGLLGPAGLPASVVQTLNAELTKSLRSNAVKAKLEEIGVEPMPLSPEKFQEHVRKELLRWGPVITAANIRLD